MFEPGDAKLRRDGRYIYEKFVTTGGVDLKAYTVGTDYVHVEARKSPGVDGYVDLEERGFEARYPIILTANEKDMISKTVKAFSQNVCGIDILRSPKQSYIVDVNGWSFVKNSSKYYEDAAWIIRRFFYDKSRRQQSPLRAPPSRGYVPMGIGHCPSVSSSDRKDELKAVVSFFRHGDITPREKLKICVTCPRLSAILGSKSSVTLRNKGLSKLLGDFEALLEESKENKDLATIVRVLRETTNTQVVNHCKLQLRRLAAERVSERRTSTPMSYHPTTDEERVKSIYASSESSQKDTLWVIVKWGGNLTKEGDEEAINCGKDFRAAMYPDDDGLLTLHATYRHDLKIYTTEESREIATAAAFAKGLLCLRGSLAQIATMCIETKCGLLDGTDDVLRQELQAIRQKLDDYINSKYKCVC